ncbi:cytochrome P450 [Gigaspora rosea]|uniref:Cytochrome P450 n=1 Tax=Gigaspora rosea TaxID=44941 RepID=A0A397VX84_9GLOM|nr:cytochrome P450 [Gigaspora rosea]
MIFWAFLAIVIIFLINYKINSKVPDGLKNIHTITSFDMFLGIITKQAGHDSYIQILKNILKKMESLRWICMIADPVIAKNVLLQTDIYPKANMEEFVPNSSFSEYLGTNVVFSSGDTCVQSCFQNFTIASFFRNCIKDDRYFRNNCKKPIEIKNLMQMFTLDVLGKVAFGFDFNNLGNPDNAYVKAYNDVQKIILDPIAILFQTERIPMIRQQNLKKVDKLSSLFKEIIKEKYKALAAGKSRGDLLELMLNANENQDNQMLSDTELRNVQENAREEVLRILGDNLIPSAEQHKSLKYLNMIICENLRLYPSVPTLVYRESTEDLKFKDFLIPAGTILEIYTYGMHHSSKLWDKPEEFLPERFEKENVIGENYPWLAFGGGSRMCLGNNFSLIEQRMVLCLLLRKYEISLAPNSIHKDGLKIKYLTSPYPLELIFKRRD